MRSVLRIRVWLGRMFALWLMLWCGIFAAKAVGADDINATILVEGSLPVNWTNDPTYPWCVVESDDGNYIRTPEIDRSTDLISTLSFSCSSNYPMEMTFRYEGHGNDFVIKVDGEDVSEFGIIDHLRSNRRYVLSAGTHNIDFIAILSAWTTTYVSIHDFKVWECKELESECLADDSMPLTFKNDPEQMWITENGYISSAIYKEDTTSKISTEFTIDKPSVFSLEYNSRGNYENYIDIIIDGSIYYSYRNCDWEYNISIVLYPGTHVVDIIRRQEDIGSSCNAQIRNVRLFQTWYDVTLNNPGELGARMIQVLGDKNLQDAELVKINGSMNSDDWAIVKELTGIKAIDFTDTDITEIPVSGMEGLSYLSTVMLPQTLTTIGDLAFYNTSNMYQMTVPASVESIRSKAYYFSSLRCITFEPDSKLKKIGESAFSITNLIEFIMPDSVVDLGDTFKGCGSLKKLHLSNGLDVVPSCVAFGCSFLEDVNIPSNAKVIESRAFSGTNIKSIIIPETVTEIGEYAFAETPLDSLHIPASVTTYGNGFASDCKNLKEVTLSSHCWNMDGFFSGCTSLEKVVLPCATPPTISSVDPFDRVTKGNVKLYVPDFALNAYKSAPYWCQFTSVAVSDESSVSDYWAIRGSLTLDGEHVMQGVPSVEMMQGGSLVIDADATQSFNAFTYNTSEFSPATFLSRNNSMTANSLECRFYVDERNKWRFFSPLTDVNMSDITYPATDSWVIRYYDGARRASENTNSGNWIDVPADGVLKRGRGYIIQATAPGWLYMPAATTEHDKFFGSNKVTMSLEDNACETAENAGWNFVANPYPSYYDIYYIDMQAPITVWTGSTYRAYSLNDGDRGDDTFVLRPMQPFFVQKATADLTIGMPLVGRQINTTIDRTRAPHREAVDENRHKLNLELYRGDKEEADDYTRIVINEEASMTYENTHDASKFMSIDNKVAQLYSIGEENHPMAINERPYGSGNVALGVYIPVSDETYRIAALRADRKAWIYDSITGMEQDLTEGDYIFTASKTGVDNSRFTIRFAPGTTSVESIYPFAVKVTGNKSLISIIAPEGSDVAVYGADGILIANVISGTGVTEIPTAAGIYVVKVCGKTVKVIVK